MKNFIVYSIAEGRILRAGLCGDGDIDAQAHSGEAVLEAVASTVTDRVENGAVVALPAQPSMHHQFDYAQKQWVDVRTVQDHIDAARALRSVLLAACDWTQLPDVPEATKTAWQPYRQALRDITTQPDQRAIVWPIAPN
jgi:hypothetical protein